MKEGYFDRVQDMELSSQNSESNFYNMEKPEIEVAIEEEQPVIAAEGNSISCDSFVDNPKSQGTLNQPGGKNLVISLNDLGGDVAFASLEKHQSPGPLQLEGLKTLVARVPQAQPGRTRPRIRRGVTPWQQDALEQAFQEVQYPNGVTMKILARQLYMGPSEVHRWFKSKRGKLRKKQIRQMLKSTPDATPNSFDSHFWRSPGVPS